MCIFLIWQQIKNSYPLDTSMLLVSNCFSVPFSTSLSWQSSNHLHLTQFNDSYNSNSSYRIIYAYHVPDCILEVLCIIYLNLVITQQPYTDGYYDPHFINKETETQRDSSSPFHTVVEPAESEYLSVSIVLTCRRRSVVFLNLWRSLTVLLLFLLSDWERLSFSSIIFLLCLSLLYSTQITQLKYAY